MITKIHHRLQSPELKQSIPTLKTEVCGENNILM